MTNCGLDQIIIPANLPTNRPGVVQISNLQDSAYKRSAQKDPISPFSSAKKRQSQAAMPSYNTVDERSPVVKRLEMKYYDNKNAYQKPYVVSSAPNMAPFQPYQAQSKSSRILDSAINRYVPDYTPFQ